jgi:hypothetical protein
MNRYSQQHTHKEENRTLKTDITVVEICRFISLIILIGHDDGDAIKDYWSTNEFYYTPFYSSVKKRDRLLHIKRYLHFENNENLTGRASPDYDRLWNMTRVSNYLNNKYSTLYSPTEHMAVDEVTVKFKGTVEFISTARKREQDL